MSANAAVGAVREPPLHSTAGFPLSRGATKLALVAPRCPKGPWKPRRESRHSRESGNPLLPGLTIAPRIRTGENC